MYRALYREYRPEIFEELIGQKHIVKILKSQVENDAVSHAYLFCGTRGTGKTTTARLLAKAVNCISDGDRPCGICENCVSIREGTFIDLIEIDAASNNGVENIRELRESIKYPPAVGRKKVYIVDEAHMLSIQAHNAFLKTLEEPPENIIFILATTEPQKIPQTILSRCIRIDFRRVSEREIFERMEKICNDKNVEIEEDALWLVAANADGSVRDGLTLLDQCISGRDYRITRDDILDTLGAIGDEKYIELTDYIIEKKVSEAVIEVEKILNGGRDARQILMGLMNHYRNLLLTKYVDRPENILNMSMENVERVKAQSNRIELTDINNGIIELAKTGSEINHTTQPRILMELAVVKLATGYGGKRMMSLSEDSEQEVISKKNQGKVEKKNEVVYEEKREVQTKEIMSEDESSKKNYSEADMEDLWDEVCKIACENKREMAILKINSYPRAMTEGEITISVTNKVAELMIENNKSYLTEIIQSVTGTAKHIVVAGRQDKSHESETQETLRKAEELLGISVNITD